MPAADMVYEKKKLVMETLFGGETENLGFYLGLLASHDRQAHDLSRRDLINVLVEVTACLPVYRTYIRNCTVFEAGQGVPGADPVGSAPAKPCPGPYGPGFHAPFAAHGFPALPDR
ncbi:MAG: hypothetical protein ABSG91_24130 [Syntrophobacteraceae bacterium]|jgi:hypothetical protein